MPKLYTYRTPLGHYTGAAAAARAHGVDKSTIMNRCATQPDQYQKVTGPVPGVSRPHAAAAPTAWVTRREWPLTWNQYRVLDWDTREHIWLTWCVSHDLDPDLETTVDLFFDQMDLVLDAELSAKPGVLAGGV